MWRKPTNTHMHSYNENWLYSSMPPLKLAIKLLYSQRIGNMVVFQLKNGYIVVYPPETWLCSSLSPIQIWNGSPITENWLYSSISPLSWLYMLPFPQKIGYMVACSWIPCSIVVYSPDNWLYSSLSPRKLWNRSPITDNWLYSSISPLNWLYSNLSPGQLTVW